MAWTMLFTSAIGLFSLIAIVLMIGMSIWFERFYKRKMLEEEAQIEKSKQVK